MLTEKRNGIQVSRVERDEKKYLCQINKKGVWA